MLSKTKKNNIVAKFKTHANDTGSPQVQIAILTEEIKELTKHLKMHRLDYSSRRGLVKKVNERKKLLKYLRKEDQKEWEKLVKALKLKVSKEAEEEEEKIEEELNLPVEKEEEIVEEVQDDAP
jgi:small subunit ribosomal protein S15